MSLTTLAQQLESSEVSFDTLHDRYHPMLEMVRVLIGVVPNCDQLLEIWPTGFRTYNLIVPNALNLPVSLFGMGAPKAQVGLAMYVSSRAAGCPYCTAHTCSFAMRRGADTEMLVGDRQPNDQAVVDMAESLSRIPSEFNKDQYERLKAYFSKSDIEGILMGVAMMGFLNKFMDAVGVKLEDEALTDVGGVLGPTGWSAGKHVAEGYRLPSDLHIPEVDNLSTYFKVIRQAPGAISIERRWTKGVPNRWPAVGSYLAEKTGYNFPLLSKLNNGRVIRALATVLRDNLEPKTTEIGLATKALTGLIFATVVKNSFLAEEAKILAKSFNPELGDETFEGVIEMAQRLTPYDVETSQKGLDQLAALPYISREDAAALILARAAANSPAEVYPAILSEVTPNISPAASIEVVVWLSVLQLFHRLERFFAVATDIVPTS